MKKRGYDDYKREIIKALTSPEPKTYDAWYKPAKMSRSELVDYFFRYHNIPATKTIKILKEME